MTDYAAQGPDASEQSESTLDETAYGDPDTAVGPLMEEIPEGDAGREAQKRVAKLALRMWEAKDAQMERPEAQWKVNAARRMGVSNAKVRYDDIDTHWTAYIPPHASPDVTPDVNKAATLCRRAVSNLFADPPAPDVVPPSGEDEDIAAAEFSTRVLTDLMGETGLNSVTKARNAFDRSSTFGSAYEFYHIDSKGGGKVPVEVQARADAEHVDAALVDPMTGAEVGPYVQRYVRPDGSLTDNKQEAATRWAPKIKSEVMDGRLVRLIPHTADDIWDAMGVQKVAFLPWGELVEMSPALKDIPEEDRKKIREYRPKRAEDLMPGGKNADQGDSKEIEDERLCFVLCTYFKQCEAYPQGLYLLTLTDQFVLFRDKWVDPNTGEALDIPATQYRQFNEGRDGYWGVALMEIIGGGNELRAAQIGHWLDHLEKLNSRKIFVPTNSIIQPEQLQQPRGTVVQMNPGGKPEYEDIPQFPSDAQAFIELVTQEMDDAAGLLDTARESSDADSGRQAYAVISQVHAGLSELRENIIRAYTRGGRIVLQLARAFFDVPQQLKWNENGKYRQKAWAGADLVSTVDVRIKPATMTMVAPVAKAQLAEHLHSLGVMRPDELREALASNVGATVALQDNPFTMRVRNQLAEWAEGPPEQGAQPQIQPEMQIDPVTGMPVQMSPFAADFARIFEPTPCDELPGVAQLRVDEIARFMAGGKYLKQPPEWRMGLDVEYQRMLMAAAPPMPVDPNAQPQEGAPAPEPQPMGGMPEEGPAPGGMPPGMAA